MSEAVDSTLDLELFTTEDTEVKSQGMRVRSAVSTVVESRRQNVDPTAKRN